MTFLPVLLLSIGLLLVVMLMAGDKEKGFQVLRSIGLVIAGMTVLALVFAVIANTRS